MGILDTIKSTISEYKSYKENSSLRALTTSDSKKRNFVTYIQIKNFERKYRDTLYKHFKIMNSIEDYEFLINIFGKSNLEKVLNNSELTTSQMGDKLFENSNIEKSNIMKEKYPINIIKEATIFNKATGLELSDVDIGISPESFKRKTLNNKNMIEIFEENDVTKDVLKEIYEMYGQEIVSSYNNDAYLRNRTVLSLDEKNIGNFGKGSVQDHVTYYSEDDFKSIFDKYFNDEKMTETEQCILSGLLAKESDLIGAYTVKHLRENSDFIKSEIDIGVFDDIVVGGKNYNNEDRKKLVSLKGSWKKDDLDRYNNLNLLKQRVLSISRTQDSLQMVKKIEEILKKPFDEIQADAKEIAEFMKDAYMDYEIENRNQIIEQVYNPESSNDIVITDMSQLGKSAMLHFFNKDRVMSNFDSYVKNIEEKQSKSLGREIKFSDEEKENMKLQYQNKENHFITDYALDFQGIGQVGQFDDTYVTNTSEQLCTMIVTPEKILKGKDIRGNLALGFSKNTLDASLIATISDKNIHSNKGIDYVESINPFQDFSASYDELVTDNRKSGGNTELVLFRNSYESSLKPSYVMYIGNDKLDSENEKRNINSIKKEMKEAGLNVPLVIFDKYSIKEKMQENQQNKKEHNDEERE